MWVRPGLSEQMHFILCSCHFTLDNMGKCKFNENWLSNQHFYRYREMCTRHDAFCARSVLNSARWELRQWSRTCRARNTKLQHQAANKRQVFRSSILLSSPPASTPIPVINNWDRSTTSPDNFWLYAYIESRGTVVAEHRNKTPVLQVK